MRTRIAIAALAALIVITAGSLLVPRQTSAASTGPSFIPFESGHVRPLALSPDRSKLFAVNTPNGTLEILDLTAQPYSTTTRTDYPVGSSPAFVMTIDLNGDGRAELLIGAPRIDRAGAAGS